MKQPNKNGPKQIKISLLTKLNHAETSASTFFIKSNTEDVS